MSQNQSQNAYRVFYTNGKDSLYKCTSNRMEEQFKQNPEIEFYQEEILHNPQQV